MKTLLAALLLAMSTQAIAIPIYATIPQGASTVASGSIIGYQKVQIGRHWSWHGKARKYSLIPLYSTTPVPEASTYALMLAGLGMVAYRVRRKREGKTEVVTS